MEANIIEGFEDPRIFGSMIKDQKTWRNWKVCLKAIFGLSMDKAERKIYRQFTGRKRPPTKAWWKVFHIGSGCRLSGHFLRLERLSEPGGKGSYPLFGD